MTTCGIAVTIPDRNAESGEATLWLDVIALGSVAEALARRERNEIVRVAGQLQMSRFSAHDGKTREVWHVVADSVVSGERKSLGNGVCVAPGLSLACGVLRGHEGSVPAGTVDDPCAGDRGPTTDSGTLGRAVGMCRLIVDPKRIENGAGKIIRQCGSR